MLVWTLWWGDDFGERLQEAGRCPVGPGACCDTESGCPRAGGGPWDWQVGRRTVNILLRSVHILWGAASSSIVFLSDINRVSQKWNHKVCIGRPDLIVLCFVALPRYCCGLKVSGSPASSTSVGTIFPRAPTHCVSLGHGLVIVCSISNPLPAKR